MTGSYPPVAKLAQHILLIGGRGQGRRRDDRQCDANALIVGEEKKLVPANRPSHADAEFIHHVTRLFGDVARRVVGMKKIVLRIEQRAVPYFGNIPVKRIRARLGEVVHLRHGITALVHGEGIGIDSRFLHCVEADDQIGREPDIQTQPRVVRVVSIENVAVGSCRQPIELDIAVPASGLRVAGGASSVHQRALRKLREIREVLPGVRQVLDRLGANGCGCIRIVEAHKPLLRGDFYCLA